MAETQARPAKDERQSDLQRLGVDLAAARAWLATQSPQDDTEGADDGTEVGAEPGAPLAVWPDNAPVLEAWMRLQTQWHRRPSGTLDGLRYDAADLVLRRTLPAGDDEALRRVWQQLTEMEHAAVEAQHGQPD